MLIADAPALDFLNSIASLNGTRVEWLSSGEDLLAWLESAQLVAPETLNSMRRSARPGELDGVAGQARALREWFRGFVQQHKGRALRSDVLRELAPLNRILDRDQEYGQIVKRERGKDPEMPSGVAWRQLRRWQSSDTLLLPIARSMADLVCTEDFSYVKACEGPTCTLLMLDKTHARARRWCSMAVCGNRAKQAAHRERERAKL